MPDAEVKQRLARIKKYNDHFAGTEHIVADAQLYTFMVNEWNVNPADYGIKPPVTREPMTKKEVGRHIAEVTAPTEKREEANNVL